MEISQVIRNEKKEKLRKWNANKSGQVNSNA